MKSLFRSMALCLLFLAACGQSPTNSNLSWKKLHDFPDFALDGKPIRICVGGSYIDSLPATEKYNKAQIPKQALQDWLSKLAVFQSYIPNSVYGQLNDVSCHIKIDWINEKGRAFASGTGITLFANSGYGTILHELGHVLGLHDTYIEAGPCQNGQPNSVMCNHNSWTDKISLDDITGLHSIYCEKRSCARSAGSTMHGIEERTDRMGSDYTSFAGLMYPYECSNKCNSDKACRSWTWVKPGIQVPSSVCYLKNAVPAASPAIAGIISGYKMNRSAGVQRLDGIDLWGNDYRSFTLYDRNACEAQCMAESECRAYSFSVSRNVCWLKSGSVPASPSWNSDIQSGFQY